MVCPNYTPSKPATQVQWWLRLLARQEGRKPLPVVDGIYGEGTADEVRKFQSLHGLPVTGVVDFATWTALRDEADKVCACCGLPGSLYVHCPGTMQGGFWYIVQAMLNSLSPHFGNLPAVAYTGECDQSTRDMVCCIQRAAGLPGSGDIDRPTWNAMAALFNANQGNTPLEWRLP